MKRIVVAALTAMPSGLWRSLPLLWQLRLMVSYYTPTEED